MIRQVETGIRRLRRLLSRSEWMVRLFGLKSWDSIAKDRTGNVHDKLPERAGLVMVQIDGLSKVELESALLRGEMPFLSRLLNREHYRLNPMYSGLPSSTPGVQGELFYGVRTAVPAFAYLDKERGEVHRMYEPDSALAVENKLASQGEPLLTGGSAYSNIYTGGAAESHFCSSSMGWSDMLNEVRPLALLIAAVLHLPLLIRTISLMGVELVLAISDALRGIFRGRGMIAEIKFIVARVAVCITLRDFITISATMDIIRGLPVIHLNYLGYDEQSHRRGPRSAFAHWSLKGIDRSIERLWSACHQARDRHYDLWIYSDHGQESTMPYAQLTGKSIVHAMREALMVEHPESAARLQSLSERIAERHGQLSRWRWLLDLMPGQHAKDHLLDNEAVAHLAEHPAVVAMGPVGHVYLDTLTRSAITCAALATHLVKRGQVPGVLFRGDDGRVRAQIRDYLLILPEDSVKLLGADHPHPVAVTEDLIALLKHPDAGDLVLLGCVSGLPAVSFAWENGAHAGAGALETGAFALLPSDALGIQSSQEVLRPLNLRHAALVLLGRSADVDARYVQSRQARALRKPRHLRIMSYNVHSCVGMDSRIAPERIARIIARYRPDVVALQEIDVGKARTLGMDQAELIARELQMQVHFHPAMQLEEEEYGNAILTHKHIKQTRKGSLGTGSVRPAGEPRGVQWLTLDVDGLEVQILNTHLGLFAAQRKVQVAELMSERWLGHAECQGPTILCGDFNSTPGSQTLQAFNSVLTNAQTLAGVKWLNTFAGRLPTICIDHVLVRNVSTVCDVFVANTEMTRVASDHLPLVVDINLQGVCISN